MASCEFLPETRVLKVLDSFYKLRVYVMSSLRSVVASSAVEPSLVGVIFHYMLALIYTYTYSVKIAPSCCLAYIHGHTQGVKLLQLSLGAH